MTDIVLRIRTEYFSKTLSSESSLVAQHVVIVICGLLSMADEVDCWLSHSRGDRGYETKERKLHCESTCTGGREQMSLNKRLCISWVRSVGG